MIFFLSQYALETKPALLACWNTGAFKLSASAWEIAALEDVRLCSPLQDRRQPAPALRAAGLCLTLRAHRGPRRRRQGRGKPTHGWGRFPLSPRLFCSLGPPHCPRLTSRDISGQELGSLSSLFPPPTLGNLGARAGGIHPQPGAIPTAFSRESWGVTPSQAFGAGAALHQDPELGSNRGCALRTTLHPILGWNLQLS